MRGNGKELVKTGSASGFHVNLTLNGKRESWVDDCHAV